jgi:cytochrome b561
MLNYLFTEYLRQLRQLLFHWVLSSCFTSLYTIAHDTPAIAVSYFTLYIILWSFGLYILPLHFLRAATPLYCTSSLLIISPLDNYIATTTLYGHLIIYAYRATRQPSM